MLDDESDIIEDDHDSKGELNDIDLNVLAEDDFECHLCEGEYSSREI